MYNKITVTNEKDFEKKSNNLYFLFSSKKLQVYARRKYSHRNNPLYECIFVTNLKGFKQKQAIVLLHHKLSRKLKKELSRGFNYGFENGDNIHQLVQKIALFRQYFVENNVEETIFGFYSVEIKKIRKDFFKVIKKSWKNNSKSIKKNFSEGLKDTKDSALVCFIIVEGIIKML